MQDSRGRYSMKVSYHVPDRTELTMYSHVLWLLYPCIVLYSLLLDSYLKLLSVYKLLQCPLHNFCKPFYSFETALEGMPAFWHACYPLPMCCGQDIVTSLWFNPCVFVTCPWGWDRCITLWLCEHDNKLNCYGAHYSDLTCLHGKQKRSTKGMFEIQKSGKCLISWE